MSVVLAGAVTPELSPEPVRDSERSRDHVSVTGTRPTPGAAGSARTRRTARGPRVLHVIAEYSAREAMGRTVTETARRTPGEHHLLTTAVHDGGEGFAGVHELGGSMSVFPLGQGRTVASLLDRLRPDLVHVHAGALGPLLVAASPLRRERLTMTLYAWPTLPPLADLRAVGMDSARASNVLQPRVLMSSTLPPAVVVQALRTIGIREVLTPDPAVAQRLAGTSVRAVRLASGGLTDSRRARFDADRPTVVFAGRAERVRGIAALCQAFPTVLQRVPAARLRLLLIPRTETADLVAQAHRHVPDSALEVVTSPSDDLQGELAAAQVGAWPFLFDYTTSPPAMAVVEAMSVGLPVVGSDVACVRAVLHPGRNGLTSAPGDVAAIASNLTRLLTDRPLWERLAAAGVRTATEELSWEGAAAATGRLYGRTTAARSA